MIVLISYLSKYLNIFNLVLTPTHRLLMQGESCQLEFRSWTKMIFKIGNHFSRWYSVALHFDPFPERIC